MLIAHPYLLTHSRVPRVPVLICGISIVILHQMLCNVSWLCHQHSIVIEGRHLMFWIDSIEPARLLVSLKSIINCDLWLWFSLKNIINYLWLWFSCSPWTSRPQFTGVQRQLFLPPGEQIEPAGTDGRCKAWLSSLNMKITSLNRWTHWKSCQKKIVFCCLFVFACC